MGIFWSSKKEKPAPPAPPAQTEEEKDPRLKPLTAGYFVYNKYREEGKLECAPQFAYFMRDTNEAVRNNNKVVIEIREMMKELLAENKELRERVERLESDPRERAI